MALTRPKIWDLDTNVAYFMDPITVLHQGATSPTTDVGFLFNRANGLVSNVALYWSESAQSFNYVFTANSGVTDSNISPSTYANVQIGSLMMVNGAGIYVGGNIGIPGSVMTSTGTGVIWAPSGGFTGGQLTLPLSIANTTVATSSTTGAFWTTGGVGFASNAYFNSGSIGQILTPVVSSTTNAAIYSQGITPNASNYTLAHNGAYTNLNANTAVITSVAGVALTSGISGVFNVYGKLNMYGNIVPAANVTYDIGSSTSRFRDLYLAGTTIDMAGATISAANGTITLKNSQGGSFSVSGSVPGQSTGTFGNLIANSGITSTTTSSGALQVVGGAGISADMVVGGNVTLSGTGYLQVPAGTSAQRPGSASNGMMRYNSTITSFEGYYAGAWSSLGGVKSVDAKAYITAEASAGAGDDVIRVYAGDSGTSTQVMWASTSNIKVLPTTTATSSTSGALQVAGGAGVAGSLYVGTSAYRNSRSLMANYTGATAPASAYPGDHWYDSSTDTIFEYIYDGTNSQWVDVSGWVTSQSNTFVSGMSVTGTLAANAITTSGITTSGAILPSANASINIGSTSAWFNTMYGKSTQAQYADLAERYTSDEEYAPGTVVVFGGTHEVTVTIISHDPRVAGIVSTDPAYLMNAELVGLPIALTGRVPCLIKGPVSKGDRIVTSNTPGVGEKLDITKHEPGCIIGKSLEDYYNSDITTIEVAVGRY